MQQAVRLTGPIQLRLTPELRDGLRRLAQVEGNPPSSVARRLLGQAVERELARVGEE